MKRMICLVMAVMLAALCLTACGTIRGGRENSQPTSSTSAQAEGKTVQGIINQKGDYLVLLTDEGEYQVMNYGKGVNADDFDHNALAEDLFVVAGEFFDGGPDGAIICVREVVNLVNF